MVYDEIGAFGSEFCNLLGESAAVVGDIAGVMLLDYTCSDDSVHFLIEFLGNCIVTQWSDPC